MKVTIIHNPNAGKGEPSGDALIKALEEAGYEPRYQSSKEKKWSRALDKRADLFAVAGGDGTVARVARRLAEREIAGVPIAVLPMGTANNIAGSLGIRANGKPKKLIDTWKDAQRITVDVGEATAGKETKLFIECVGAGFFADMMAKEHETEAGADDDDPHKALERARKVLRGTLKDAKPRKWKVELDGQDQSGSYLLVEAMNMRRVGPGLELAPDATFDDGLIEVAFVCDDENDRANLDAHLKEHPADEPAPPLLRIRRAKEVMLDTGKDMLHVDDKSWTPEKPVRLAVGKHKLTFLVPQPPA